MCIFWNSRGAPPNDTLASDSRMMGAIRRVNLYAFWRRATATVIANKNMIGTALKISESVGLTGPYRHTMSMPPHDHCRYEVAVQMVLFSLQSGKHDDSQSSGIPFKNQNVLFSSGSPQANWKTMATSDERGHPSRFVEDECASYWFSRLLVGCKCRMGQDWRPNNTSLIVELLSKVDNQICDGRDANVNWIIFGAYVAVTYVLSICGVEGLLLDLAG
jgi:uncharacterized protein (DUF2237 family)